MKHILDKYSNIITDYDIIVWESEPTSYRFKARIAFIDGSYLAVKDYLFPGSRKYAFHWEDAEGKRIIRWDNAPHWKSVATYPHHRHENSDVYASVEVSVEDVLGYISRKF